MTTDLPLLPLVLAGVPRALASALECEGIPHVRHEDRPTAGHFVVYDSRMGPPPPLAAGQQALDVALALADVRIEQLDDSRTAIGRWEVGPLVVQERVSRIDKATLRRDVLDRLRGALESAGGFWLRVGAYPYPYRTVFGLRIDHDAFAADDFERLLRVLRGAEHATTHFVCASTHVGRAEAIAALSGLDVASHGYWHHSYGDPVQQRRNIERGIDALRAAGLQPRGFAAPHGRHTPDLGRILDELGVDYSSEFGWLYDDLPLRQPGARAWQAPVHPVCLGIALEAARREAERDRSFVDAAACAAWTGDYFAAAAAEAHAAGAPLLFYGHPDGRLGRHPEVVAQLLRAVRSLPDVWWASLGRFVDWWKARCEVQVRAWRGAARGRLVVECTAVRGESALPLALEHVSREGIARWPWAAGRSTLDLEECSRWSPAPRRPARIAHATRESFRERVKRWIDYERQTPRAEIPRDGWRGRVKYAVRVWRDAPRDVARRAGPVGRATRVRIAGALTASLAPGGGERQLAALIAGLQAEGLDAAAWHPWEDAWSDFDLLHLIGSCPEHLPLVDRARRSGKPVVLSPVAWFDGPSYWRRNGHVPRRAAGRLLLAARRFAPWMPGWRRKLYRSVDRLLPNSRAEADQLVRLFGADPRRIVVVPNGADPNLESADPRLFAGEYGLRDFVLCAGRIEPRKNQLRLLQALAGEGVVTVVLGDVVPGQEAYYDACRRAGGRRARFLPRLDPDSPLLASAYAACGCLAQPSWFETPGLAALEAAMTGAPLAVTQVGAAPEYFGRLAHYVDPYDQRSVRRGVAAALDEGRNGRLAELVRSQFTWQHAARATREVYAPLL